MATKALKKDKFKGVFDSLMSRNISIKLTETQYTKTIKYEEDGKKQTLLFNDTGKNDFKRLKLMNLLKNNSKELFLDHVNPDLHYNYSSINYSRIVTKDLKEGSIDDIYIKVDLSRAYWNMARKMGIVTPEIDAIADDMFGIEPPTPDLYGKEGFISYKNYKVKKYATLASLGSLATQRKITYIQNGDIIHKEIDVSELKPLYIILSQKVSNLMSKISFTHREDVIAFYHDCFFVKESAFESVIKSVEQEGFQVKLEGSVNLDISKNDDTILIESVDRNYLSEIDSIINSDEEGNFDHLKSLRLNAKKQYFFKVEKPMTHEEMLVKILQNDKQQ